MDTSKMSYEELAEYCAKLQTEISEQEMKLKAARADLFVIMKENDADEVETLFGRFYKAKLPLKKTYPSYIEDMEYALNKEKAKAEANDEVVYGEQAYTYKYGKLKI